MYKKLVEETNKLNSSNPFAVFVVVEISKGKFAATTRAKDKINSDEGVMYGFPGGKVDNNESPIDAAIRESEEEGWQITDIDSKPFYKQIVQKKVIWWYKAKNSKKLDKFKEKDRIIPIEIEKDKLIGFGNENAIIAFYK